MKTILAILVMLVLCFQVACSKGQSKASRQSTVSIALSDSVWKQKLSPAQYFVLREKGTEAPFSGEFLFNHKQGVYSCAGCGNELFTDQMKFDSHCGWPSFDREIAGGKIKQTQDLSHGMRRVEITCANCGGHLGHLFEDGPTLTGMRYCVNSAALTFAPSSTQLITDTITLGAGCFWCVEAAFAELKGVKEVVSGYSGGMLPNPSYKEVCSGATGHAEVVQIVFYPDSISLSKLFEVFFSVHNPTTLNRQGNDVGTQYRSVVFYRNRVQKDLAEKTISILNKEKAFPTPIVTQVSPFHAFYPAENYHQEYYQLNKSEPYCQFVIKPKLDKLHKLFANELKSDKYVNE